MAGQVAVSQALGLASAALVTSGELPQILQIPMNPQQTLKPWLLMTGMLLVASSAQATQADETNALVASAQDDSPTEAIEAIIKEHKEAMGAFYALVRRAPDDAAKDKLYDESYPSADSCITRIQAIVKAHPADESAPIGVAWLLRQGLDDGPHAAALEILLEHHIDSDMLGGICLGMSRDGGLAAERFLRAVCDKSSSRAVLGTAHYSLAGALGARVAIKERLATSDAKRKAMLLEYYDEKVVALVATLDVAAVLKQRVVLLEKVCREFGDVPYRNRTLADLAGGVLFDINNLQVGMVAPQIKGDDLDGTDFKLTDYRGKVVFLDFWGDW